MILKIIFLGFVMMLLGGSVLPAMGQSESVPDDVAISITADKNSYLFDEMSQISGKVSERVTVVKPVFKPAPIKIKISGPDGYEKNITMFPDFFLRFHTELKLQKVFGIVEGVYMVSAEYAGATDATQFSVGDEIIVTKEKETDELTVSANKESYLPGETVTISAFTNNVVEFEGLHYTVTNPMNEKIYVGTLFPDRDGMNVAVRGGKLNANPEAQFSTTLFMDTIKPMYGTYTIKAEYSTQKTESTFRLTEDVKDYELISLTTDKPVYDLGEKVTVSGRINNLFIDALDLEILQTGNDLSVNPFGRGALDQDPRGVFKILDGVRPEGDSSFRYEFTIPNNSDRYGTYRVTVSKEIGEKTTFFSVAENLDQFAETAEPFSISTNKAVYDIGETAVVSGSVIDHKKRSSFEVPLVSLSITDKDGEPLKISALLEGTRIREHNPFSAPYELTLVPDSAGNFRGEMPLSPLFFEEGTYLINGDYDDGTMITSTLFVVRQPQHLGKNDMIVHLDKEVYRPGETVVLEGTIPRLSQGTGVTITLIKPDGNMDVFGTLVDGSKFSWRWTAPISEKVPIKSSDGRTELTLVSNKFGVYQVEVQTDTMNKRLFFEVSPNPEKYSIDSTFLVYTEKDEYKVGEKLNVLGTAPKRPQGTEGLVIPDRVQIIVSEADFPFRQIYEAFTSLDHGGNFKQLFELPLALEGGKYKVAAKYQLSRTENFFSIDNQFDVGGDDPLTLLLNTDKDEYGLGETVKISGKPNKLVYLENMRITVIHEDNLQTTCGSFVCGRPGVSSAVFPDPSGLFTYEHYIPISNDSKGRYEVIADTEFGIFSIAFTVTDAPSQKPPT